MYGDDRAPPRAAQAPSAGRRPEAPAAASERIAIGVVLRGSDVLVGRRLRPPLAGLSEFPGGKVLPGETPKHAVVREVREETGLQVRADATLSLRRWRYSHGLVDLHFFLCRPTGGGSPRPRPPFEWVPLEAISRLRFPPANATVLRELVARARSMILPR